MTKATIKTLFGVALYEIKKHQLIGPDMSKVPKKHLSDTDVNFRPIASAPPSYFVLIIEPIVSAVTSQGYKILSQKSRLGS